jgi:integrase
MSTGDRECDVVQCYLFAIVCVHPWAVDTDCYPEMYPEWNGESMALTDARVRTLKPNGAADRLVADGNGLYIRLRSARGDVSRTWVFRRKTAGRMTVATLGTYPALSVRDARLKAAELATQGTLDNTTVQQAATQWLAERVDPSIRKADQVRGYVERAILPLLGQRRVRNVEPSEIARVIRDYRDRVAKLRRSRSGGRPAARALLAVFKGLFGYAVANGWIAQSPAAQLTAAIAGPPSLARARVLSDDEICFVMTTTIRPGPMLRFLVATGLRLGEAYNGHREGRYWVVPASASKNGREHRVWLSRIGLAQLEAFPWASRREAVQNWLTYNSNGWTAHDLRRTFSTRNNAMGVPPYVVERMLNHTFDGVMAVYNHATYDDERRAALDAWSAWLEKLVSSASSAEIVPLRPPPQRAA